MSRIAHMREYYDRRAPWHDDYMDASSPDVLKARFAEILHTIYPFIKNADVLEIACGTGNWTRLLAPHARTIAAIDSSARSLAIASAKLDGAANVTFQKLDAFDLAQLDRKFDCVFAADWYSHIPHSLIDTFFASVTKIVRPGAQVILIDMTCFKELADEISGCDDDGNCLSRRVLPDGSVYEIIKNFPTAEELIHRLSTFSGPTRFLTIPELSRWMTITNISSGI